MLHAPKGRVLIIWGIVFFLIAVVLPTKDRFVFTVGGRQQVIARQDQPLTSWGAELIITLAALTFVAAGLYRARTQ
jgi:uncharacterized membrane protein